jgi:hypothetical protein
MLLPVKQLPHSPRQRTSKPGRRRLRVLRAACGTDPQAGSQRSITYTAWLLANAKNDQIATLFDVIGINRYFGCYIDNGDLSSAELKLEADIRDWVEKFDKPVMMTEYGADTMAGLHSLNDIPGWRNTRSPTSK